MIELFLEIHKREKLTLILSLLPQGNYTHKLTIGIIQFIKDEKEKTRQKQESEKSFEKRTS